MAQLYTEHLSMREIRYEDYEEFLKREYQYFSDEYHFFTKLKIQEVLKFVEHHVKIQSNKERNEFVLLAEYDNKIIGGAALWIKDNSFGEIGFCLKKDFVNDLFKEEIIEALLKFGFNHFNLEKIEAPIFEEDKGNYSKELGLNEENDIWVVYKDNFLKRKQTEPVKNISGQTEADFLRLYNPELYKKAALTSDICIFSLNHKKKLELLMVKRGDHPYIGHWALPGGFFDPLRDEHLLACAERELKEETHLSRINLNELKTWSRKDRDPRDRIVTTSFIGFLPYYIRKETEIYGDDDAADANFFEFNFLEKQEKVRVNLYNTVIKISQSFDRAERWEKFRINKQGNIASDHGVLIYHAFLSVRERFWLDARGFELLDSPFSEEDALLLLNQFAYKKRESKMILKYLIKRGILKESEEGLRLDRVV